MRGINRIAKCFLGFRLQGKAWSERKRKKDCLFCPRREKSPGDIDTRYVSGFLYGKENAI
uniref:Uncharacterized protein n=1 Tax=Halalkalibacterium halodurans TaxID=86665 RepID=A0A0M0KC95_ALKHA